jgi:hypothetical protein
MDTAVLADRPELGLPDGVTLGSGRTYRGLAKSLGSALKHLEHQVPGDLKSGKSDYNGNTRTVIGVLEKNVLLVQRLAVLEDQFKILYLDSDATRSVRGNNIPLIFRARLPLSAMSEVELDHRNSVKAKTPHPPREAEVALIEHKDKFDHVELWWVPKAVEFVNKDPILVGVIHTTGGDRANKVYFEIYRWMDETVESPYWAHEAY